MSESGGKGQEGNLQQVIPLLAWGNRPLGFLSSPKTRLVEWVFFFLLSLCCFLFLLISLLFPKSAEESVVFAFTRERFLDVEIKSGRDRIEEFTCSAVVMMKIKINQVIKMGGKERTIFFLNKLRTNFGESDR